MTTTKQETERVELVFDGASFRLPAALGIPREDQCQGTPDEQTIESAGRVCYDSYGKGRPTSAYHKHILDVKHLSVFEHVNFTVAIHNRLERVLDLYRAVLNRPGVWMTACESGDPQQHRITLNVRALVEWHCITEQQSHHTGDSKQYATLLGWALSQACRNFIPEITSRIADSPFGPSWELRTAENPAQKIAEFDARVTTPVHPQEKWITLYMRGGRGWSHEQVRHKYGTAVSQRSTRYVDESQTPYATHPLIREYDAHNDEPIKRAAAILKSREAYDDAVADLQAWLRERGVDKQTARKQARGAARGYLGNALTTDMLFSANVQQWRWMLHERGNPAADAEIRELFAGRMVHVPVNPDTSVPGITTCVLTELRKSKYRDSFADIELRESPDGLCNMTVMPDPKLQ